jgi:hypothetical protein
MTERQWLKCTDASEMYRFLWDRVSDRKFRLLGCHCCRQIWHLLVDERSKRAIEVQERYCDGSVERDELNVNHAAACDVWQAFFRLSPATSQQSHAAYVAFLVTGSEPDPMVGHVLTLTKGKTAPQLVGFIRCMFGNPFRPVTFDPAWRTDTTLSLARQINESRDFSAMPILADALQDAGCDNDAILDHCRGPGPHVRGCWVVDLVLGKE